MNTSLPDIRDIAVPCQGGALRDALGDLDSKLTAFTAAMQAVEARLGQIAQPQEAAGETGSRRRTKARAAKAGQVQETVVKEAPRSAQEAPPQKPAGTVQEQQPPPADVTVERPEDKKTPPADALPADITQMAPPPETGPAQAPPQEAQPAASEDEVLMASLDEETCKAIKVMRRLDPHRPVKELLKRIEERKDTPRQVAKPAGKSWFKRR